MLKFLHIDSNSANLENFLHTVFEIYSFQRSIRLVACSLYEKIGIKKANLRIKIVGMVSRGMFLILKIMRLASFYWFSFCTTLAMLVSSRLCLYFGIGFFQKSMSLCHSLIQLSDCIFNFVILPFCFFLFSPIFTFKEIITLLWTELD